MAYNDEQGGGFFVFLDVARAVPNLLMCNNLSTGILDEIGHEAEIVELARRGDESAYGQLVRAYHRRVFHFIRGMVKNNEDAEDLAQDVFVKAYFNLRSLKNNASFKSWLFRIAYNVTLDFIRKKKPQVVDTEDSIRETFVDVGNPKAELTREHTRKHVRKCLDMLNDQQRNVLVLCDLEGMSYQEIADSLSIPFGTVQSRIFYARKKLRELLESTGFSEGDATQ